MMVHPTQGTHELQTLLVSLQLPLPHCHCYQLLSCQCETHELLPIISLEQDRTQKHLGEWNDTGWQLLVYITGPNSTTGHNWKNYLL